MLLKNTLSLFLIITSSFLLSCGGHNQGSSNPKSDLSPVKASINLRLGQLAKSSTPVAVSAALENGESIIIFKRDDGINVGELSLVYKNASNQVLRVIFDKSGRPISAESNDSFLTFENYTLNTVDITISFGSPLATHTFLAQPIDTESLVFLDSNTIIRILLNIDNDEDSPNRTLLATAFSSLKIVGCISDDVLIQLATVQNSFPEIFADVTRSICGSQLLDSIKDILDKRDYKKILVIFLNSLAVCDTAATFETEVACGFNIAEQNILVSSIAFVGNYPPPENTPEPSAIPTESLIIPSPSATPSASASAPPSQQPSNLPSAPPSPNPSPPPAPPPSENLGAWSGDGMGSSGETGCRNYYINFSVSAGPDDTCSAPNQCTLTGKFDDQEENFFFEITGQVNNAGHFKFTGNSGSISVTGEGDLANGSGTGNFTIDIGSCTGTMNLTKGNP